MGNGYWILVYDGFGLGLNLINPRMHTEEGNNWFTCDHDISDQEIIKKHNLIKLYQLNFMIIRK